MPDRDRDLDLFDHRIFGISGQLSCPTTPVLRAQCELDDRKAGVGVMGKVTAPYSPPTASGSTSPLSAKNSAVKQSSTSYPFTKFHRQFRAWKYEPSGREPALGAGSLRQGGQNKVQVSRTVSASPPTSKRNARQAAPICITEMSYEEFKLRQEVKILRDSPGSSGRLGPCLALLAEVWAGSDDVQYVMDVEEAALRVTPAYSLVSTAGFSLSITSPARGIRPWRDEYPIEDPDRHGLEGFNHYG